MMKLIKNKYLQLILVLFLGLLIGFYIGFQRARIVFKYNYDAVETFNTFAKYEIARDIAISLKKKDYENAKCLADLEASSGFDYVKECIDDKQCAQYIYKDVKERTPEVLSNTHPNYDYLYVKNGIRRCDAECLTPPSSSGAL